MNTKATAGLEFGTIKDDQMKSSNHPNDPYPAYDARLNGPRAWCGNPLRKKLYLQIDFLWNFEGTCVQMIGCAIHFTIIVVCRTSCMPETVVDTSATISLVLWEHHIYLLL